MDESRAISTLKRVASKRVDGIRKWHEKTFQFLQALPKDVQGSVKDAFAGGFVLPKGQRIDKYGAVYHIDVYTARLLFDILKVIDQAPKVPFALSTHRAFAATTVPVDIPHLLPLATSLRGGFTYHWLQQKQSNCCSLRIRLHKGAKALFWGPPPNPSAEDMHRMKAFDPAYSEMQFEVLLPPCVLVKEGLSRRKDIQDTQQHVPEFFANLPKPKRKTRMHTPLDYIQTVDYAMHPISLSLLFVEDKIYLYANDYTNNAFARFKQAALRKSNTRDVLIYDARKHTRTSPLRDL